MHQQLDDSHYLGSNFQCQDSKHTIIYLKKRKIQFVTFFLLLGKLFLSI